MKTELIKDKIKVFISSSCEGPLKTVRKALSDLLEETTLCSTYVFENEAGSTCDVIHSYMWPLEEYHLVVVLIDASAGIGSGTLKEINRAKTQNKKIIYVFCNENKGKDDSDEVKSKEKEVESFKSDLYANTKNPKTVTVNTYAEMPYIAYETAMRDITNMYIYYCRGYLFSESTDFIESITNESDQQVITAKEKVTISQAVLKKHTFEKEFLCGYVGIPIFKESRKENDECPGRDLLGTIIGERESIGKDTWEKLKNEILDNHSGAVKKVVAGRLQAFDAFQEGKIQESIDILSKTLEKDGKAGTVPEWLKGDILIDLRNLYVLKNKESKELTYNNEWQDVLNERQEPVYYPVIDRCQNAINESIIELYSRDYKQSPYTVNLGGTDSTIDKILDAFAIALHFGSITQAFLVRKRLYEYLIALCFRYRDHNMYVVSIEQMLLSGSFKELQKFNSAYGETTENIVTDDVIRICKCVKQIPFRIRRFLAKIYVTKLFGYYFDDASFTAWWKEVCEDARSLLNESFALYAWVNPFLETLDSVQFRIDVGEIIDFLMAFYGIKRGAWIDTIFKTIKNLDLSNITDKQKKRLVSFLEKGLLDEWTRKNAHAMPNAIMAVRLQLGAADFKVVDNLLEKNFEGFYKDIYKLELFCNEEKSEWNFIKKYINDINDRNEQQGKNGTYAGYSIDPYAVISNIINHNQVCFDSRQLKVLLEAIKGTLISEKQTIDAKCAAINMLITVQKSQPKNKQVETLVRYLSDNWAKVSTAQNVLLLKGYSQAYLLFEFACLKDIISGTEDNQIINVFAQLAQSEKAVLISTAKFCSELLQNMNNVKLSDKVLCCIAQFIVSLSYDENVTVRFYSMIGLIALIDTNYRELVIGRLTGMMDSDTYQNKVGLLSRIRKYKGTEDVDYLFRKGEADNHYWVRNVALMSK